MHYAWLRVALMKCNLLADTVISFVAENVEKSVKLVACVCLFVLRMGRPIVHLVKNVSFLVYFAGHAAQHISLY